VGGADGSRSFVELPEGEDTAGRYSNPDNDQDWCGVFRREAVPHAEDVPSVVNAKPCRDDVAHASTAGEGDHELLQRHLECPRGQDKGAERHGRRKEGGQGDREDCVALHPVAYAFEDVRIDAFFEEGHAAALADQMAQVSADRGSHGGKQYKED